MRPYILQIEASDKAQKRKRRYFLGWVFRRAFHRFQKDTCGVSTLFLLLWASFH